ncbi:MAG: hypothetical protein MUC50_21270 [Myxococcota bacterium]|jgi:hypothetical protein|nr:hypothetical protein [Myxococcota bacterium]
MSRSALALENLALRQQVNVLRRRCPKPLLTYIDRLFWVGLSRVWPDWRSALDIVKPETVLRWHKLAFKAYWRRKCERGRKPVSDEVIALIRKFHAANPTWQIIEAFPEKTAPKYLIRDRDGTYGKEFRRRIKNMGIEEVLCAPRSP